MGVLTFEPCEECRFRGWVHSLEPFEVQSCDNCTPDNFYDQDAILRHREDCGCDWPEFDFPHAICRWLKYSVDHVGDQELSSMLEDIREWAEQYGDFVSNVELLMVKVGNAITHWEFLPSGKVPEDVGNSLANVAELLVQIFSMKRTGRLPKHWFQSFEMGTYNEHKDRWTRPKE